MPTRKNELSSFTGYWDIWPERQAPKGLNSYFFHYISTDEVEMYCHRSRDRYFMVTETTQLLNNYWNYDDEIYTVMWSNLSRCQHKKNELSSFTGYWDIRPERQAPKGLNSYFFHFTFFLFFVFCFCSSWNCPSHNWSKVSSNQADFLHTHREVKSVPGDA